VGSTPIHSRQKYFNNDIPYYHMISTTNLPDTETITSFVSRILRIDDITSGTAKQNFLIRYRGQLYSDPISSYNSLTKDLYQYGCTPLFREEGKEHVILIVEGSLKPKASNPLVNLFLFTLTLFSMVFAGAMYTYNGPVPTEVNGFLATIFKSLPSGIPFATSLLAILLAHEFGHYIAGRLHKTHVTLPYFIPFPFSPFGTMGAFIQLKEPPRNRRVLLDIGIAGPIAGFIVAIPILLYGLSISYIDTINLAPGQGLQLEGNSILYLVAKYLVFGQFLPSPMDYGGISPLYYWVRYFFTSQPLPIGGLDVLISPVAWAGWAGLLVTALNLIPAGQLDGGHVIYTLIGKKARLLLPIVLIILILLGFAWSGWWIWAVLILLLGRVYAEPLDQITKLNTGRKILALAGLVIFLLVFTPVPLVQTFMGP
jgi:membrane-associated protease RseP (regulator of RpoE activity)